MKNLIASLCLICSTSLGNNLKEKNTYFDDFNNNFNKTPIEKTIAGIKIQAGIGYETDSFSVANIDKEDWMSSENIRYLTSRIQPILKFILYKTPTTEIGGLSELDYNGNATHFIYGGWKF